MFFFAFILYVSAVSHMVSSVIKRHVICIHIMLHVFCLKKKKRKLHKLTCLVGLYYYVQSLHEAPGTNGRMPSKRVFLRVELDWIVGLRAIVSMSDLSL